MGRKLECPLIRHKRLGAPVYQDQGSAQVETSLACWLQFERVGKIPDGVVYPFFVEGQISGAKPDTETGRIEVQSMIKAFARSRVVSQLPVRLAQVGVCIHQEPGVVCEANGSFVLFNRFPQAVMLVKVCA